MPVFKLPKSKDLHESLYFQQFPEIRQSMLEEWNVVIPRLPAQDKNQVFSREVRAALATAYFKAFEVTDVYRSRVNNWISSIVNIDFSAKNGFLSNDKRANEMLLMHSGVVLDEETQQFKVSLPLSLSEIGQKFDITRSRAHQIVASAESICKRPSHMQKLPNELAYSQEMYGLIAVMVSAHVRAELLVDDALPPIIRQAYRLDSNGFLSRNFCTFLRIIQGVRNDLPKEACIDSRDVLPYRLPQLLNKLESSRQYHENFQLLIKAAQYDHDRQNNYHGAWFVDGADGKKQCILVGAAAVMPAVNEPSLVEFHRFLKPQQGGQDLLFENYTQDQTRNILLNEALQKQR